jgi:hypothetical protein
MKNAKQKVVAEIAFIGAFLPGVTPEPLFQRMVASAQKQEDGLWLASVHGQETECLANMDMAYVWLKDRFPEHVIYGFSVLEPIEDFTQRVKQSHAWIHRN